MSMARIKYVIKRNGATVPFSKERITNAIYRAAVSVGGRNREIAEGLSGQVVQILESRYGPKKYPTVEEIQDIGLRKRPCQGFEGLYPVPGGAKPAQEERTGAGSPTFRIHSVGKDLVCVELERRA